MAGSQSSKGTGKASPAALDNDDKDFKMWVDKEKKRKGDLNWFPNSPPSPTGK